MLSNNIVNVYILIYGVVQNDVKIFKCILLCKAKLKTNQ